MSDAIQYTSAIQGTGRPSPSTQQTIQETGSFRGEIVVAKADMQSILLDAAEEITALHGERSSKELAKRKASGRDGRAAELAAKFVQRVPDIGQPEKFHALAEALRKPGAKVNAHTLGQLLREQFGDISHQYAGLMYLDELLSETSEAPELLANVRQLRWTMDEHHGPEIRAGLNVTGVALRFEQLDGPQNFARFLSRHHPYLR